MTGSCSAGQRGPPRPALPSDDSSGGLHPSAVPTAANTPTAAAPHTEPGARYHVPRPTRLISALLRACCTGPGTRWNRSEHKSSNSCLETLALKSMSSRSPSICHREASQRGAVCGASSKQKPRWTRPMCDMIRLRAHPRPDRAPPSLLPPRGLEGNRQLIPVHVYFCQCHGTDSPLPTHRTSGGTEGARAEGNPCATYTPTPPWDSRSKALGAAEGQRSHSPLPPARPQPRGSRSAVTGGQTWATWSALALRTVLRRLASFSSLAMARGLSRTSFEGCCAVKSFARWSRRRSSISKPPRVRSNLSRERTRM